ncbi:Uncharacterised protein [uncultured Ruminococcus sp.]|uniref:LysM domain-containing protein n=1 Tax=Massiliimalia timonensis TaxID=1987501 RepID=A0A8J6PCM7_9FIRM|nr:hypothetical protein [Massiliimalia timonensis]MBC8610051.1 hypothetical protein [Massiliimalia timonensis]SCH12721.1 Uncharacterised protein [uncultured Ruminococcus sp.]SCH80277.1 Uncharacterised protein [uncultured Clostridium sp.]
MATQFQFKDYTFAVNPGQFQISRGKILKAFQPPMITGTVYPRAVIQPIGVEPILVTGRGELIGENVMEEYTRLYQVFIQEESGLLYLPNLAPFYAYFQKLEMTGKAGPNILSYEFSFLEDCGKNQTELSAQEPFYISRSGDTLCLISVKTGKTVEELLLSNPALQVSGELSEGTMVWL